MLCYVLSGSRQHIKLAMATTPHRIVALLPRAIALILAFSSKHHANSFTMHQTQFGCHRYCPKSSGLHLLPLSEVWDISAEWNNSSDIRSKASSCEPFSKMVPKLGCKSLDSDGALIASTPEDPSGYKLYLATNIDDLPSIAHLTLEVFDATAITLSCTSDWSAFEKAVVGAVVEPAISMYNSYANAVGYIEVLSGLRRRMLVIKDDITEVKQLPWLSPLVSPHGSISASSSTQKRLTSEEIAATSSLILILARMTEDNNPQVAASVEIRLQPTDAKIPFSQPWLDNLERKLVHLFPFVNKNKDSTKPPLRPYLCNLCVSESLRNLGIGRALCRIVEAIASQHWGYDHLYLHVDPDNDGARILYEKEGYEDVGKRWSVLWAGGSDTIGYYMKKLR